MSRRWVVVAASVAVVLAVSSVLLLLRSCGDRDDAPQAALPSYDPPYRFDPDRSVNLPREADGDPPPVALHAFTAYIALPGRLQVMDTRTGDIRVEVVPPVAAVAGGPPRAPVLARLGGREVVVVAFGVAIPGHGTTVGHDAVELVVLDRDTLERLPGARVDLPPALGETARLRSATVLSGGQDVITVAVEVGPDREPVTYAVDLSLGTVRWRVAGFAAAYAENDLLVGVRQEPSGSRAQAVAAADGRVEWTVGADGGQVTVARGGQALVAVVSVGLGSGQRSLAFLDVRTGRPQGRHTVPGGATCRFDEQLITVCWNADAAQPWAAGFDAATARRIWELPAADAGRVAPRVTTVWHGAVYGTTDNGPVVLRGLTGKDWTGPMPPVAPDLVNDVVGIVGATIERPRPRAYPAVG